MSSTEDKKAFDWKKTAMLFVAVALGNLIGIAKILRDGAPVSSIIIPVSVSNITVLGIFYWVRKKSNAP
jgi:hypothetical protein